MGPLVCVDVRALPLQVAVRAYGLRRDAPVATVAPGGMRAGLTWVNRAAARAGIRPGDAAGPAVVRCPGLQVVSVTRDQVDAAVRSIVEALQTVSPKVEVSQEFPGAFFVDVSGLHRAYPAAGELARAVRRAVGAAGFTCGVAVGFSRFGTWVCARTARTVVVSASAAEEAASMRGASLAPLVSDAADRRLLRELGCRTVGDLAAVPLPAVQMRFGEPVRRLRAAMEVDVPVQPAPHRVPLRTRLVLDTPDADADRFAFAVKHILDGWREALAARGAGMVGVDVRLTLADGATCAIPVAAARPETDVVRMVELARMALVRRRLDAPVAEMDVAVRTAPLVREQGDLLFCVQRDLGAARRGVERVAARFGAGAVCRIRCADGWLPEARWRSEPALDVRLPVSGPGEERPPMVRQRRVWVRPVRTSAPRMPGRSAKGRGAAGGGRELVGPFVVCGGWWVRWVHREYYFAKAPGCAVRWVYYDAARRSWWEHGWCA